MRTLTALNIAVGVCAAIAIAAIAPPAQADEGNPFHPKPAASTETADHGHGSYCTVKPLGALWSCEAPKLTGGGTGTGTPDPTSAEKQAFGAANQPKSPDCGPKS